MTRPLYGATDEPRGYVRQAPGKPRMLPLRRDKLVLMLLPGADRRRWVCRDCRNLPGPCSRTGCGGREEPGWRRQSSGEAYERTDGS